jgi:hypothetical protein
LENIDWELAMIELMKWDCRWANCLSSKLQSPNGKVAHFALWECHIVDFTSRECRNVVHPFQSSAISGTQFSIAAFEALGIGLSARLVAVPSDQQSPSGHVPCQTAVICGLKYVQSTFSPDLVDISSRCAMAFLPFCNLHRPVDRRLFEDVDFLANRVSHHASQKLVECAKVVVR